MQDSVKEFLESGQLESYIIGVLNPPETAEVERWIAEYPEVRSAYDDLQDQIEQMAMQQSVAPPAHVKEEILNRIPDPKSNTATQPMWLKAAAAILLVSAGYLWYGGHQSRAALAELQSAHKTLEESCNKTTKQLIAQQETNSFIQDKNTEVVRLESSKTAFESMVFVNESQHKLLWKNVARQELPANKCLQLWGDHEGEMIALGVVKDLSDPYYIALSMDFESLNVTIEDVTPDGKGQPTPDVSQLIASVAI